MSISGETWRIKFLMPRPSMKRLVSKGVKGVVSTLYAHAPMVALKRVALAVAQGDLIARSAPTEKAVV